jgi:hypothetical protein
LQYRVTGKGDDLACQCVAKEISTGAALEGPTVTMAMAKAEGWATKSGSKWRTMPDLMIRYRAAAMWGRLYIPDMLIGISYSQEEVMDIEPITVEDAPQPEPAVTEPANELF